MAEKMDMKSKDWLNENTQFIAERFPNCVTETEDGLKVDFELLQQELSGDVVSGSKERYRLEWPGKRQAMVNANLPTTKTLRPVREDSVDFDNTENLYIEGDNLEVLKILQESYLGKIKMIYIDPPYNTGKDFVYKDNFTQDSDEYKEDSGQTDEYNRRLVSNPDTSGRYHSDWLSMMYPRLKLSRNLLLESGYFVICIDDAEFSNLKAVLDDIFGEHNLLATLVVDKNRKNDAKYFSVGHEYMIVYAKSRETLDSIGVRLRAPKEGISEARDFFQGLRNRFGQDTNSMEREWRAYFKQFDSGDDRKKLGRFSKIHSERGPYRDDGNISWPGGGGPEYEVLHPSTGKPCKVPEGGWRYSKPEKFWEEVENGKVGFGEDETTLPRQIRYLFEGDGQVQKSVSFSYAQTATMELIKLLGGRYFDNPKNYRDISNLIDYFSLEKNDFVFDFFSGSGSTAHAVMNHNAIASKTLRYIMVQLPESVNEKSDAYKAGYKDITDIGRDRIKRAAEKIKEETGADIDYGFKVYRVDVSNMEDVYYQPQTLNQGNMDMFASNIKADRTSEDLLTQVLLDWGLPLTLRTEKATLEGKEIFKVAGDSLYACFDEGLNETFAKAVAAEKPLRLVVRDSAFASDTAKVNVQQLLKQLSPNTELKVL